MKIDNTQSLSHTSYRCKYHIVIVPKYRRMVIYNRLRRDIIEILKVLIQRKPDVRIIEGEACPDHIHMLLEIPPKYSVAEIMGYLKSKSTLMIFDRHANLKYKYGNRHFWARGYFVDTVGKNEKVISQRVYSKTAARRQISRLDKYEEIYGPDYGIASKKVAVVSSSENERSPQHNALIGREHTTSFRRGYDFIL